MYAIHDFTPSELMPSTQKKRTANRKRRSMKIPAQLKALGLPAFEGRQHCGIDVSIRLSGSFCGDRINSAKLLFIGYPQHCQDCYRTCKARCSSFAEYKNISRQTMAVDGKIRPSFGGSSALTITISFSWISCHPLGNIWSMPLIPLCKLVYQLPYFIKLYRNRDVQSIDMQPENDQVLSTRS